MAVLVIMAMMVTVLVIMVMMVTVLVIMVMMVTCPGRLHGPRARPIVPMLEVT